VLLKLVMTEKSFSEKALKFGVGCL